MIVLGMGDSMYGKNYPFYDCTPVWNHLPGVINGKHDVLK